jgi:hypothetical protein
VFGLSSLATYAIAAALIFASGALSGWRVEAWHRDARDLASVKAAEAERDALQQRYTDASRAYEAERARTHVVYKTIYKQADAWVANHPATACLDPAGVVLVNSALAPAPDPAGKPDPAVPGSDAPR